MEDENQYYPFTLEKIDNPDFKMTRLMFWDWDWITNKYGSDTIDGYHMNGHAVQGLVIAARFDNGMDAYPDSINYTSEGDYCIIDFDDHEEAKKTAEISQRFITDQSALSHIIKVAHDNNFADWDAT